MNSLFLDAITLPFFWLFTFIFIKLTGYGLMPFKTRPGILAASIFTHFWYGLGICMAFLQLWNLFLPVGYLCWLSLLPVTVYGGVVYIKDKGIPRLALPGIVPAILLTLIFLFLITSSLDNIFNYDTLAYQFYSIKWIEHYPATKGLGNLYILLSYNQSYFLLPAFFDGLWAGYKGACATNGLLAAAICTEIIYRNGKYLTGKEKLTLPAIFQLLFLPLCINIGVQNLSSPYPDVAVNLLTFKVLADLIRLIEKKQIEFQDIFIILFYCTTGILVKLSFAGIAIGCLVVALVLLHQDGKLKLGLCLKAVAIYLTLLLPWLIRGAITTGYIAYPLSVFGLPVDWKIPLALVKSNADYTVGYSRIAQHGSVANDAAHGYAWIPIWIKGMLKRVGFVVPIGLFLITMVVLMVKKIRFQSYNLALVPITTSVIFWFFTAPDLRFVVFTFWGLGLASLACLIFITPQKWAACLPVAIGICSLVVMFRNRNTDLAPLGDLPKQQFSAITTRSGLKLNYISGNPKADDWRISDCKIPCTVFPDSNITLRGTDIKDGFRTDSAGAAKTFGK